MGHERARRWLHDAAVTAAAAGLALALVRWLPVLAVADTLVVDAALRVLAPPQPQDSRVAIVAVTEDTLAALPYRSPVDRGLLAGVVLALKRAGVAAVGLDVLLDQPTEPAKDAALAAALRAPGAPVVAVTAAAPTPLTGRQRAFLARFLDGVATGHGNLARDRVDDAVRRHVPRLDGADSLPAALARLTGALPPDRAFVVAWHGRPDDATRPFPVYPAQLVAALPAAWLAGRVVLVGADLPDSDRHRTPLGLMAGIEIQAHILAQLIEGRAAPLAPPWAVAVAALTLAAAGAAAARAGGAWPVQMAAGAAALAVLWAGAAVVYLRGGPLLPPLAPSVALVLAWVAVTLAEAVRQRRERALLMRLFATHVSEPVAAEMWAHRDEFLAAGHLKPQQMTATALFSDIEGFTPISESLTPPALMGWLETYMEAMTKVVTDHDGVVLRFIGDGILAVFGVPVAHTAPEAIRRDARQAVRCALAMDAALAALDQAWQAEGLPTARLRLGLFTGPMVAGSLGGRRHLEYCLVGDAVNVAARLEALAKTVAEPQPGSVVRVLVGETTWELVQDHMRGRAVGAVALKGKSRLVSVYQVLGEREGR